MNVLLLILAALICELVFRPRLYLLKNGIMVMWNGLVSNSRRERVFIW